MASLRWACLGALLVVLFCITGLAVADEASKKEMKMERTNPNADCVSFIQKGLFSYRAYCARCHGQDARGGGPDGSRFDPPASDLVKRNDSYSDEALATIIEKGRREMPGWEGTLSDEAIWAIISWLRLR